MTRPAIIPAGSWPRRMSAGLAAGYCGEESVEAFIGGLMAYGADGPALFRQSAKFVQRVLQGQQPNDLPIEQPTKFELAVNLKTAKAMGLTIPESFLLRADALIE